MNPRGDLTKIDHKGIILCVVAPFPIRSLDELRSPFTCNVTRRNLTTSCHQKLQQSQITSPQPLYAGYFIALKILPILVSLLVET